MNKNSLIIVMILVLFTAAVIISRQTENTLSHGKNSRSPVQNLHHKTATMEPGRVAQLNTTKGTIEFVLFEKDCPKTTARLISFFESGKYDGAGFILVDESELHTDQTAVNIEPLEQEIVDGLVNAKGTIGMVPLEKESKYNSASLYILKDPKPIMDAEYTVVGRLIYGMDVVYKLSKSDNIINTSVRNITESDRKAYTKILQIEAERLVE